ncbi:MAG: O-antigen ligase family protein [Eubacterium sp.]|nr:O-antigen ligase family protein [Eubacterium sp.]
MAENILTTIPLNKYKNVKPDWAFFIYFAVIFCLYMNTWIQLGIQLFIIGYVVIKKIIDYRITFKINQIKNVILLILWLGMLALLFYLSTKFWAYSYISGSRTMLGVFRGFALGLVIFIYVDSTEKALSLLQSFAYASVIMGVAALITTSPSQYFQAGEGGFGQVIGQQRNGIGGIAAAMSVASLYLKRYTDFKYGEYLSGFFVVLTVLTGSRGGMIQLLILFVLIVIVDKNLYKMMTKAIVFIFTGAIVLLIMRNVPILYENVWVRFGGLITTLSGKAVADTSTQGREYYKEIAFEMFKQRPLLGWGLDGFVCYLRDNPIYNGYYIKAVYSHCNFSELMANLGIAGLIVWYVPTFYVLIKGFKYRDYHPLVKILFFLLTSMIILDYARIPWLHHPSLYNYFIVFLLIQFFSFEAKKLQNKTKKTLNTQKGS